MISEEMKSKIEHYSNLAYELMSAIPRDKRGNPLTLEGAIKSVMLKNPDSKRYRDSALETLYCVLGSSIDWIDGRLGDSSSNNYMNMPPEAGGQGIWSRCFGMDESMDEMFGKNDKGRKLVEGIVLEKMYEELRGAFKTIDSIEKRCQQYGGVKNGVYPISWYGCNLCAPANAQQDFFDGAIETATMITKLNIPIGTKQWMVHQRTKTYASQILEVLHKVHRHKAN
jgi:hypothetical protein